MRLEPHDTINVTPPSASFEGHGGRLPPSRKRDDISDCLPPYPVATLRRHHPSACDYVFDDLAASTGAKAVAGVATFLGRLQALEKGSDPARAASKTDDKAAVKLLAKRGLEVAERARLQLPVEVALGPTASLDAPVADSGRRREKLVLLRGWFDEWSSTARAVVKKRAYPIRLSLATRKVGKKVGAPPPAGPQG